MRLIHASTLTLVEFFEPNIPPYAILSHTWEDGEVSFQEMGVPSSRQGKQGFVKIMRACEATMSLRLEYIWVDTCCIDKTSNAELTESINSMFEWYRKSWICIVFLADFGPDHDAALGPCKWFSRGWTLQELIAPKSINFYNSTWAFVGTKRSIGKRLSDATKIPDSVIAGVLPLDHYSVAQRMSWAAGRKTTRVEDRAYSLLGLFDISMPMLYGEGTKAFRRLQEEIIKRTNDLTILGWRPDESFDDDNEDDNDEDDEDEEEEEDDDDKNGYDDRDDDDEEVDDDDEDDEDDQDDDGYQEDYYDEDDSVLPALAADPDAFRFSHGLQRSRIFEMPTSHTNRGLQLVQRRLFLLPRSSDSFLRRLAPGVKRTEAEYLYLLEVGRNSGGDYVCIPIRQVGFGTYFRERHPLVVRFKHSDRVHLGLTSPHKFLLATTLSRSIPTTTYHLCRSAEPLHGAIYIGTRPLLGANHHRFEFVQQSPSPKAAYDHATGLVFLPRGIGLEVFACEYNFVDEETWLIVHIGVLLASSFSHETSSLAALPLAIVNLDIERFQILFALLRRNPEEPMTWTHVLELLGPEGSKSRVTVENADTRVIVSADVDWRRVKIGGKSFGLPCLQLKSSLL